MANTPKVVHVVTHESHLNHEWEAQERFEARFSNIGKGKYGRVLRMARKGNFRDFFDAQSRAFTSVSDLLLDTHGDAYVVKEYRIEGFRYFEIWRRMGARPASVWAWGIAALFGTLLGGFGVLLIGKLEDRQIARATTEGNGDLLELVESWAEPWERGAGVPVQ